MKKFDLIKLVNEKPYENYNLEKGMHGIVIDSKNESLNVLFFNPQNQRDYLVAEISIYDAFVEKEKLPKGLENKLMSEIENIKSKNKKQFKTSKFKMFDVVEFLVDDERYLKYGICKGEQGTVISDNAIQNRIEVDFSGIDENGNYYGDCISVKIDDLKLVKQDK